MGISSNYDDVVDLLHIYHNNMEIVLYLDFFFNDSFKSLNYTLYLHIFSYNIYGAKTTDLIKETEKVYNFVVGKNLIN